MDRIHVSAVSEFMQILGIEEEPMGMFFSSEKPVSGFSPEISVLPTREKEIKNEIDWQQVFGSFSCVMGKIRLARQKKTAAFFSAEQFGCPGAAFWLGFTKPQAETIIHYVSSGIPGRMEGELYCDSPDNLRKIFEMVDPVPATEKYCVFKPLSQFSENEIPVLISFFCRPESLSGLHQMAFFVTNDPLVVASPWSAACGSLVAWPLYFLNHGQTRAVVGGWDPSARKYFKTDELSFTIPFDMFKQMLVRYKASFLVSKTWQNVQKKIKNSKKAWKEI